MHISFENLPSKLQEEIISYLQADNFITAKRIRDEYERKYLQGIKDLSENNALLAQTHVAQEIK